ncbi:MAG: MATE family efflux transporter [Clostridiales bacterium]|nr:MATE family efflux transporter [Clostridiales bacterium]
MKDGTVPAGSAGSGTKSAIKGVTTTLDFIDFGSENYYEEDQQKTKAERKKLPENITSQQLYKDILRIAWPSLIELFLSSLVNMVDTMMVGRIVGTEALSAVGLATQPKFIFMSMIMALNTGATALVSRARGANDQEKANIILRQSMVFAAIISIVCAIVGTMTSKYLVIFMANGGMSDDIIKEATLYLQIQMIGFPTGALAFSVTAALRGTGNTKPAMVYNIIANLVNILGNWLLIGGNLGFPAMGVAGASLATVIGQLVGTILALACVFSGRYYLRLRISWKNLFKFDKDILSGLVTVGLPAMIEQLIMRAGVIIFTRMIAGLGPVDYSTHQVCLNIQSMSFMLGQAFATAATSLVGQSIGKRRLDMAQHYSRCCQQLGAMLALMLGLLMVIFRKYLVMLYSTDGAVIARGATILFFVAFLQPIQSGQFITGGILRGAGDTKAVALYMLLTVVVIRTVLCYIMVNLFHLGIVGAWIAQCADQCTRTLLFIRRYNKGYWKKIKLLS